jgi:hypothetical protein
MLHLLKIWVIVHLIIIYSNIYFLGGGRKIRDPEMETNLYNWYEEYHVIKNNPVTSKMIKQKALEFTKYRDFIASKGWLEKFKKKYHLDLTRSYNRSSVLKNHPK